MESSDEDNGDDSKKESIDWGLAFSILKNRGFNHKEILNLSYPVFNMYMRNVNNPLAYSVVIPYLGSGEETEKNGEEQKFSSKEELLALVASMNNDFS